MPGDTYPICSMEQSFSCAWTEWEKFEKQKMGSEKQKCPLPCRIDTYHQSQVSRLLLIHVIHIILSVTIQNIWLNSFHHHQVPQKLALQTVDKLTHSKCTTQAYHVQF